jgi:hypothetical protein
MPKRMNDYDACFSDTIIQKYPNVVGMLANVNKDAIAMKRTLNKSENSKYSKYFKFAEDVYGVRSIPELAIYPLAERSTKDVLVKPGDTLDNTYKLFKTFSRSDKKSITNFLDTHTKFDPSTFYYTYKA